MPIVSIISQPGELDLKAAYRPVVLVVRATNTAGDPLPPVVYCDIYADGVFYKSQEKTLYSALSIDSSDWQFDIQDACQEILKSKIGSNGNNQITAIPTAMKKIFCRFRSSGINVNGFVTAEGTAPVQGTGKNAPVAGDGTESNAFFVANTTLQHDQNQLLPVHLNAYKTRSWQSTAFPLSHRRNGYKVGLNDSDVFPIINLSEKKMQCLVLNYKNKGQNTFFKMQNCSVIVNPGTPFDAVDNVYSCYKNYWLNVPAPGLKANDIDEDLSTCIVTADEFDTEHGHVVINADGSFFYTPADDFLGADSFTYLLTNQYGMTDTAVVIINVRDMETGMMIVWPHPINKIPVGWYLADGSLKNIASDAALFALCGTEHGGDGVSTFGLPDPTGRGIISYKAGHVNYGTVGATGGADTHILSDQEIRHDHIQETWDDNGTDGHQISDGGDYFRHNDEKVSPVGNMSQPRAAVDMRSAYVVYPWIIKR